MYDITKAAAVKKDGQTIGYIFQLNGETWLPLNMLDEPLGPPSYKADAQATIERRDARTIPSQPAADSDYLAGE